MNKYDTLLKTQLDIINNHKINLTEEDVFNFLKITRRWSIRYNSNDRTVETIDKWGRNSISGFFDLDGLFLFDEWKKFYECGLTTILVDVLDLSSELRDLSEKLFNVCGKKLHANFYFSKGSESSRVSFHPHSHNYDVIVKPIYGKSLWKINDDYNMTEEHSFLIPAGTMHSVEKCVDRKLSLTINID